MDLHFRAFSFVDRITMFDPGVRIRGEYLIPASVGSFVPSLVAEAVGQLAAWAAMAVMDFKQRPVAGLVGNIELLRPVRPGQRIELAAEMETVESDAAAYGGEARVEGVPVLRLHHCVGPMMPVEDFDDPAALRSRFEVLCGGGAVPGAFGGLPHFPIERTGGVAGRQALAQFQVPARAHFFADHFPRRHVFPGSLLMQANLELASALAEEMSPTAGGASWVARGIADVKLRAFTPPGEVLEMEADVEDLSAEAATLSVETRKGRRVVGGARVRLAPGNGL